MYDWLRVQGFKGGDILEPAVGQGVFIDHMPQVLKERSVITTVELDSVTSQIFTKLHPTTCHHTLGFEHYHSENRFDLIIGNLPYGTQSVEDNQHADFQRNQINQKYATS